MIKNKLFFIKIIIIIIITITIYYFFIRKKIEGFTWSKELINEFLQYQNTSNRNVLFNMQMVQQQASPDEAHEYLNTGLWKWTDETKYLFIDSLWSNNMLKIDPNVGLHYARTIYNENAMKQLLSWNTKEGQFLLNGATIGNNQTIKCSPDENGNSVMQKTTYNGYNLWNGYKNSSTEIIKKEDIPDEVPGFSFIDKPCNPCEPLNFTNTNTSTNAYTCPFKLNTNNDTNTSSIWSKLWNL